MKKLFTILVLFNLAGCKNHSNETVVKVEVKQPQNVNIETQKILNGFYENSIGDTLLEINKDTLITYRFFNKLRNAKQLMFSNKGKLTPLGDSLFYTLKNARFFGLCPNDYHFKKLEKLTADFYNKKQDYYDATALAEAEVLFTDAYLKFGAHLN
ncbi:MAG: hypothetical protein WCH21_10930, partial [Bacteroidota bacterium]